MAINNFNVGVGTTSQLTRYRYVATGGETSVSGTDADGKTLSYTVGLEQVFLNGVNLVRGQDYTATNGTSVGALTALVASDVVEVFAYVPFNIANALTVSTVDAKGDLLVGTGADAVGRLAVGTNGQLLSAASGETSGLKWANGGMTLIKTETFSAAASVNVDNVFTSTYENYQIVINFTKATSGDLNMRLRASGTDATGASDYGQHGYYGASNADTVTGTSANTSSWGIGAATNTIETSSVIVWLFSPQNASRRTLFQSFCAYYDNTNFQNVKRAGGHKQVAGYDGFSLIQVAGSITGSVSIYGYNK